MVPICSSSILKIKNRLLVTTSLPIDTVQPNSYETCSKLLRICFIKINYFMNIIKKKEYKQEIKRFLTKSKGCRDGRCNEEICYWSTM